ncbi:MAG: hypothetical protein ABJQ71_01150 [Roseibium sp.]
MWDDRIRSIISERIGEPENARLLTGLALGILLGIAGTLITGSIFSPSTSARAAIVECSAGEARAGVWESRL